MNKEFFGNSRDGKEVSKYSLSNGKGLEAVVTDFGATLVELVVPDKDGKPVDVALGYDDVSSYERETTYFGATVGPYANRVGGGKFDLDGVTYELEINDNGENNLHSGSKGVAKQVWNVKEYKESAITFCYDGADLEQGFPGNIHYEVSYVLTEDNGVEISYHVVSDKKTALNMTNHTYFNLNGSGSGDVLGQELMLKAYGYTPMKNSKSIPTGEIATVEGTPFDFRVAKPIGRDIKDDHEQLLYAQGYDHNFAIDKENDGVELIGTAYSPTRGIQMEVFTDLPGVQLYTGNFMGGQIGKDGYCHGKHDGFCLETQLFPNCINDEHFIRPFVEAGAPYVTKTIYRFSTR